MEHKLLKMGRLPSMLNMFSMFSMLSMLSILSMLSGCSLIVRNKLEPEDNSVKDGGGAQPEFQINREGGGPREMSILETAPPPSRVTGEVSGREYFLIGERISFLLSDEVLVQEPDSARLSLTSDPNTQVPCKGGLDESTFRCSIPSRIPEGEYMLSLYIRGGEQEIDREPLRIQRLIFVGNSDQAEARTFFAQDLQELEPYPLGGNPSKLSLPLFSPSGRFLLMSLNVDGADQLVLIDVVLRQSVRLGLAGRPGVNEEYNQISPHSFKPETVKVGPVLLNYPEQQLWLITADNKLRVINAPETIRQGRLVESTVPLNANLSFHQVLWAVDPEQGKHLLAIGEEGMAGSGLRFLNGNTFSPIKGLASSTLGKMLYISHTIPSNLKEKVITTQRPESLFLVFQQGLSTDAVGVKRLSGFVEGADTMSHAFSKTFLSGTQILNPQNINPLEGTSLVGFTFSQNLSTKVPYGVALYDESAATYDLDLKFSKYDQLNASSSIMTTQALSYRPMFLVTSGNHLLVLDFSNGEEVSMNKNASPEFLGAMHSPAGPWVYVAEPGSITKYSYNTGQVVEDAYVKVDWLVPSGGGMLLQP